MAEMECLAASFSSLFLYTWNLLHLLKSTFSKLAILLSVFVWYLHNAGWHSISLGAAVLLLLQLWTICSSTNWELAHFSGASALPFGPIGVVALLGASWPFGPLSRIAVFGHDAGLEGHWQRLLRAQAGDDKMKLKYFKVLERYMFNKPSPG